MKLAETVPDSRVVALTAGGDKVENSKMKKAILSRGPAEMVAIKNSVFDECDAYTLASALGSAISEIGDVDLVVCGEGSGDMYSQQTGNLIGAIMGLPAINAVCKLEVSGDVLTVERNLEDGLEVLEVKLPAVVTVTSDIVFPKIPSMKDIMGAGKKPLAVSEAAAGDSTVKTISVLAPAQTERKQIIVKGDSEEAVQAFYENIRKIIG